MEDTQNQIQTEKGKFFELPIDVSRELAQFSKMFVSKEVDYFRLSHCFENIFRDYKVFGELPNGDKSLLFTVRRHFDCCKCDNWGCYCCCFTFFCCNQIFYQMDYKRNNVNFYTQGINYKRGCYFCHGLCKYCPPTELFLRENGFPDNADFEIGNKKGKTKVTHPCCMCCAQKITSKYTTQEGFAGPEISIPCGPICRDMCIAGCLIDTGLTTISCCTSNVAHCYDLEMDIHDGLGNKTGNIIISNGCCSKKVAGLGMCYTPRGFYEINCPVNATSIEKFQIIADIIQFDIIYSII